MNPGPFVRGSLLIRLIRTPIEVAEPAKLAASKRTFCRAVSATSSSGFERAEPALSASIGEDLRRMLAIVEAEKMRSTRVQAPEF